MCRENNIVVQAYGPVGSGTSNTFVGGPQDGVSTHGKHENCESDMSSLCSLLHIYIYIYIYYVNVIFSTRRPCDKIDCQ